MKTLQFKIFRAVIVALLGLLFACAPVSSPPPEESAATIVPEQATEETSEHMASSEEAPVMEEGQLPIRYQQPAYLLKEMKEPANAGTESDEEISIPVGADISSTTGPVALRDILKRLAALKNMNISWASDVDQFAMVDVDIRAEDDFFKAIDNILRQMDYFHVVKGNSIVVKYRETRKFHIAMPYMASTYSTGVGGDVLGAGGGAGTGSATLVGNIQITSNDNKFDIWGNIRTNLDQILEIWEETAPETTDQPQAAGTTGTQETTTTTRRNVQAGKGYYTIDNHIGLITVTAPRRLVQKIELYLNNLKEEIFRQVSIEAKIIEVQINDTSKKGIDWSSLLDTSLDLTLFGANGVIYAPSTANRAVSQVALTSGESPFAILISALETQGPVKILANPKISVMNGQPALISIGETIRYIKSATTTVSDGVASTSVETDNVMSGLGMSVLATIMDNDEIVLSLTPVTSKVDDPILEETFNSVTIQLPQINIREMNTIVRVKSGNMLMIGGLIDNNETEIIKKVPFFGDVPGMGKLFSHETKTTIKKELVILLMPTITL